MLKYGMLMGTLAAFVMQQGNNYPGWITDTRKAFDVARATGKPLFIVFR